jgi:hypothetical protein
MVLPEAGRVIECAPPLLLFTPEDGEALANSTAGRLRKNYNFVKMRLSSARFAKGLFRKPKKRRNPP